MWFFSGCREVFKSSLKPLASWFSSSTWVLRTLAVVQAWVKVRPFLESRYLASMSPIIASDLVWLPWTLKVTPEGVFVLTSSDVPWK